MHLLQIHPRFGSEYQGLTHCEIGDSHGNLIAQLGELARAVPSHVDDVLAQRLQDRQTVGEHCCVSAHHNGERPGDGPAFPTAHRRVEEVNPLRPRHLGDLTGHAGRDGAHVDDDPTCPHPCQYPSVAQNYLAHIRGIGHHGDHHL